MPVRVYKPTSPAAPDERLGVRRRHGEAPRARLVEARTRNPAGARKRHVTSWHRAVDTSGCTRAHRLPARSSSPVPPRLRRSEYDPNRSARIALLHYADGEKRYILAPVGLGVGDSVMAETTPRSGPAMRFPLANIPLGTVVHNVELKPGKGGQLVALRVSAPS